MPATQNANGLAAHRKTQIVANVESYWPFRPFPVTKFPIVSDGCLLRRTHGGIGSSADCDQTDVSCATSTTRASRLHDARSGRQRPGWREVRPARPPAIKPERTACGSRYGRQPAIGATAAQASKASACGKDQRAPSSSRGARVDGLGTTPDPAEPDRGLRADPPTSAQLPIIFQPAAVALAP